MIQWRQSIVGASMLVALFATSGRCEPLEQILEQIDRHAQSVVDLTCAFEEAKHTALLKNPIVSKGKLFIKQGRTRWHTTTPYESVLFTDSSSVAIYFPSSATMEIYPVDHRLADLIVSPIPRMQTLRRHFKIERVANENTKSDAGTIHLRLTPKDATFSEFIERAQVLINTSTGLALRFEMFDSQGDRTVITFTDARTNTGLSDSDVARTVPSTTKIVRPFGSRPKRATPLSKQP